MSSEKAMPTTVNDHEIERLIERLATLHKLSRSEVLYEALRNELERHEQPPSLAEEGVAFVRALHARVQRDANQPADKSFIEELYER
jgi:antitoxin VapB